MALTDEINSCSFNSDAGQRLRSRPQAFCDAVQMDSTLNVSSTLSVGADAAFATKVAVTQALTLGAPIAPAKVERTARRSQRTAPPPAGDLSVAGLAHIGNELRLGSGYYASFKKNLLISAELRPELCRYHREWTGPVLFDYRRNGMGHI